MSLDLLNKFYNNECSPEEVQQVLKWFQDKKLQPENLDELRELWDNTPGKASQRLDTEPELNEILHKIIGDSKVKSIQTNPKSGTRIINSSLKMAWMGRAAAILLFAALLGFFIITHKPSQVVNYGNNIELMSLSTPKGAKKTFSLPDGTVVTMNSLSTIIYPEFFNGDTREVTLTGEAFFEVRPDTRKPFIVKSGELSITALGTAFNVKSNFMNEEKIAVSLVSGKVKVVAEKQSEIAELILNPGEQAAYSYQNQSMDMEPFSILETLSWKEGVLRFNNTSFNQVIHDLEMWYGVEITVKGTACQSSNWRYTGEFDNQTLDMVLRGIGYVKDFRFKIDDKKATIYCP